MNREGGRNRVCRGVALEKREWKGARGNETEEREGMKRRKKEETFFSLSLSFSFSFSRRCLQ